jgi:hypothetical protein
MRISLCEKEYFSGQVWLMGEQKAKDSANGMKGVLGDSKLLVSRQKKRPSRRTAPRAYGTEPAP